MKLFPYFGQGGVSRPLGLEMSQNRLAVPTWSYAMEVLQPARIIEIGHAGGGFTTAIALHAYLIGAAVWSIDLCAVNKKYESIAHQFGVHFVRVDVWSHVDVLERLITSPGPTFILCDGGDKHRELATFAPFCKPGDVIAAHDYDAVHEIEPTSDQLSRPWPWSETRKAFGDDIAQKNDLEPWLQENFDLAGWLVYRRKVNTGIAGVNTSRGSPSRVDNAAAGIHAMNCAKSADHSKACDCHLAGNYTKP